ncbi:MAG: apolipoprotein N-acyltransferase, partial [Deltaproteobacteria bacterium]|nr:apolipoprotein N-acyltransferase [Deltaproteobacteria bacterium]
ARKKKKKKKKGKKKSGKAEGRLADYEGLHPIVGPKAAWGLATLSGVLCPVGFVGIGIWPVAFVAWIPLIIALRGQTPKRALALGWYAGFLMTMIGFYWLVEMLEVFSGFPLALCVLFAALLCVQKGGRMALMAWLYARAAGRGWHHGLSFLGAFAVSELVYPLLFPWYYGASVHDVPLLMQTAELGGPILVSIMILAVNVGLAELLERPMFRQKADLRMLVGGFAFFVVALVYGAVRMASVDAQRDGSEKIKVALVQPNTPLKGRGGARKVHLTETRKLAKEGVDLVVWSEAAWPGGFNVKNYKTRLKRQVTRFLKVPTIVGGILREKVEPKPEKGRQWRAYNVAFMADDKGEIVGRYDKQYLLMFGEYLPLGDTFPVLYEWSPNSGHFTPGTSFEPLPFGKHRIATMICYEDIIPTFVNKMVAVGDPDLLVNMTNDTWFGDTSEPWQHLALAKFRTVEHRRYLVRVTNSGVSAIVDPVGRVVTQSEVLKRETLIGDIHFMTGRTVFATVGQIPWWIVTALMALGCLIRRKRPAPAGKD